MIKLLASATLAMALSDVIPPGIAQDGSVTWWAPLINTGAIGIVLGWFMIRMEPRMRAIEASIDTVSRALMLSVLSMKFGDRGLQEQAQAIIAEIDSRNPKK